MKIQHIVRVGRRLLSAAVTLAAGWLLLRSQLPDSFTLAPGEDLELANMPYLAPMADFGAHTVQQSGAESVLAWPNVGGAEILRRCAPPQCAPRVGGTGAPAPGVGHRRRASWCHAAPCTTRTEEITMQCYDCAIDDQQERSAAAVCATCGAGLCVDHTTAGHAQEAQPTLGNPVARRLPGRRLFCRECAPAHGTEPTAAQVAALV